MVSDPTHPKLCGFFSSGSSKDDEKAPLYTLSSDLEGIAPPIVRGPLHAPRCA